MLSTSFVMTKEVRKSVQSRAAIRTWVEENPQLVAQGYRRCSCGHVGPQEHDFIKISGQYKNLCRSCRNASARKCRQARQEDYQARHKKWIEENPLEYAESRKSYKERNREKIARKAKFYGLKKRHGLSQEDFERMCREQGEKCAICGDPPMGKQPTLCVDHCHRSGRIRSLLCKSCNRAIGLFKEDPKRLLSAVAYLRRHAVYLFE